MLPTIYLENVKCSQCGNKTIYIDIPVQEKEDTIQTIEEYVHNLHKPMNAIYKLTTYRCKTCGHSVSR